MKINIGNRIKYNELIYKVVGINFSTFYLRVVEDGTYDYDMKEVYKNYKDFEILRRKELKIWSIQ